MCLKEVISSVLKLSFFSVSLFESYIIVTERCLMKSSVSFEKIWNFTLHSFDYENAGYQPADLIKMDILLNGRPVAELTTIVHRYCNHFFSKCLVPRICQNMFSLKMRILIILKFSPGLHNCKSDWPLGCQF